MQLSNVWRVVAASALALATGLAGAVPALADAAVDEQTATVSRSAEANETPRVFNNLQYVDGSANPAQQLFIQLPETGSGPYPLVVYIHGGGWSKGNYAAMSEVLDQKKDVKAALDAGYAVAAVNYRLTDEAQWPAQILDVKAAIRYLRANAAAYGYDASRIAVLGASAGGHLAQFLGVTNGAAEFEDKTMGSADASSDVQAVLSDYGIADLTRYKSSNLLGSGYTKEQAEAASPISYVSSDDVPFYIAHAADDPKVKQQISKDFAAKLKDAIGDDKVVEYYPETGGHGSAAFYNDAAIANELDFLRKFVPLTGSGETGGSGSDAGYDPSFPSNNKGENTTDYLMAYFVTANDYNAWEEQVYFATSRDSREWTDLHKATLPVLTSTVSCEGIRDPFLLRTPDGSKFYILATDQNQVNKNNPGCGWNVDGSRKIIIWESTDLVNWSQPRAVDVGSKIPSSDKKEGMVWAPEAVWDEENQQYVVFWSTNSGIDDQYGRDNSPNQYYATTKDFVTFSDPVKWIDRKGYTLDSTMMKAEDGYWYRVHNAGIIERTKNLYATSFKEKTRKADDAKEWKYLTQVQSALSVNNKAVEGNEFLVTNKDDIDELGYKYAIVADQFKEEKGFGIVRTNNLAATTPAEWHRDDKVDFHQDPAKGETIKKHGSFLNITSEEYDRIHAAYDGDKWPVTFDSQGGSAVAMETFAKGEQVAKPADPTREGYAFAGWTLDAAGTQPFDFSQPIDNPTGSIALYAQWEQNPEPTDTTAPVIAGVQARQTVEYGADFDPLAGVSATDDVDGPVAVTVAVTFDGTTVDKVDTTVPGDYALDYAATDAAGNTATATATVTVKAKATTPEQPDPDQPGTDQPGTDQPGSETPAPDADQNGSDQDGTDQPSADQNGSDQGNAGQTGANQTGANQTGTDQTGTDQNATASSALASTGANVGGLVACTVLLVCIGIVMAGIRRADR